MRVRAVKTLDPKAGTRGLTTGTEYLVVGFDDENYAVVNDDDEPVLYSRTLFEVVDPWVPEDWVRVDYEDGEYHVDAPECAAPGFYEDVHDGQPPAVATFRAMVARLRYEEARRRSAGER